MSSRVVNDSHRIRFKMRTPSHTTEIRHADCSHVDEFLPPMVFCVTPIMRQKPARPYKLTLTFT